MSQAEWVKKLARGLKRALQVEHWGRREFYYFREVRKAYITVGRSQGLTLEQVEAIGQQALAGGWS